MPSFTCYFVHSSPRSLSSLLFSIRRWYFCFSFSCAGHPGRCKFFYWINNICNSIGENGIFSYCVYAIAICHLGRFCVDINVYDEGIRSSLSWYDSDDESPQISKRKAKERPNGSTQMKNWQCPQRSKIVTTPQYNTTHIHIYIEKSGRNEEKKSVHVVVFVFVLVFIFQPDMNATIALQNVHDLILKTLTIGPVHFRYDRKIMHHFSFLPHFQHCTQSNIYIFIEILTTVNTIYCWKHLIWIAWFFLLSRMIESGYIQKLIQMLISSLYHLRLSLVFFPITSTLSQKALSLINRFVDQFQDIRSFWFVFSFLQIQFW